METDSGAAARARQEERDAEDEREALVRRTAHTIGVETDEIVVASGATGINVRQILERAWTLVQSVPR